MEFDEPLELTVEELRALITSESTRSLSWPVRALFLIRKILGLIFRLDSKSDPTFEALYTLPHEAAYQVVNKTVDAIVIVVINKRCLFWATYIKPVGRITAIYMRVINPFRHYIVYPGLEAWIKRII